MQVEFVMLADAAQVVGGKLYLLGGAWNLYRATAFPTQAPVALVASILVDRNETGMRHSVRLTVADEAGIPIIPALDWSIEVGASEGNDPATPQRSMLAVNTGIQLPRAGRYSFTVTAGNASRSVWFDAIFVGTKVESAPGSRGH
jgi:hypothetical protein